MTPSIPVKVPNVALPVSSCAISMKNKMAKLPKTNCSARFVFKVPKNMANVNKPHMKKYAAKAVLDAAPMPLKIEVLGNKMSNTRDHQKNP